MRKALKVIGVAGRAGSGKDPAAQVLAGFSREPTVIIPLAYGLKAMLAGYYGIAPDHPLLRIYRRESDAAG
jgi:hypothetical protein